MARLDVGASLRTVLDCVAQPVWVVDHAAVIRFANPAAITALGYDDLSELQGKPSHETVHYKHPDGSPFPVEDCPMLLPRTTGETIHSDEDWFVRRDGSMFPVSYWSAPIDMPGGRGAVVAFTDIEESRRAEQVLREHDAIVAAVEQRREVVRDLHDGAQQRLVHAVITLKLALRELGEGDESTRALVREALYHAEQANSELRELVYGILPGVLTSGGLRAGIEDLASHSTLLVKTDVSTERLPPSIEATAYFVVSEALTNAMKYSGAHDAKISAQVQGGVLRVEVRDDGVGGADPGGSGLTGLRERVEALGGTLEISSPRDSGTSLLVRIPLEAKVTGDRGDGRAGR
jgi:PAS domain S-box-containing protein